MVLRPGILARPSRGLMHADLTGAAQRKTSAASAPRRRSQVRHTLHSLLTARIQHVNIALPGHRHSTNSSPHRPRAARSQTDMPRQQAINPARMQGAKLFDFMLGTEGQSPAPG